MKSLEEKDKPKHQNKARNVHSDPGKLNLYEK